MAKKKGFAGPAIGVKVADANKIGSIRTLLIRYEGVHVKIATVDSPIVTQL